MLPHSGEVVGQGEESLSLLLGDRQGLRGIERFQFGLALCENLERLVPSQFELGGNQSIRWLSTYRTVKAGLRRSAYRPRERGAFFFENEEELDSSLAWVVNTEDDSILPTRIGGTEDARRVAVLEASALFGEAIRRIASGESVVALRELEPRPR